MVYNKKKGYFIPFNPDTDTPDIERSDWNMAYYHFPRYHKILEQCDYNAMNVLGYNSSEKYKLFLDDYFASLSTLYLNLKPNMIRPTIEHFEQLFAVAEQQRLRITQNPPNIKIYPTGFINLLKEIHAKLLFAMHNYLGLGYPKVKVDVDRDKLIERKLVGIPEG